MRLPRRCHESPCRLTNPMTTPPDGLLRHNGRIVGYLFDFGGQGVYSPDGHTQYRPDQVDAHNAALAQAELRGLDEACQGGQCGPFYLNPKVGVTTFTGV